MVLCSETEMLTWSPEHNAHIQTPSIPEEYDSDIVYISLPWIKRLNWLYEGTHIFKWDEPNNLFESESQCVNNKTQSEAEVANEQWRVKGTRQQAELAGTGANINDLLYV